MSKIKKTYRLETPAIQRETGRFDRREDTRRGCLSCVILVADRLELFFGHPPSNMSLIKAHV
jgi:hypothetical protein